MIDRMRNWLSSAIVRRFMRFLVAGAVNAVFSYSLFAVLILVSLPPQTALILTFLISILWNYLTTGRYVFGQRNFRRLPAFFSCYVIIYSFNAGALHLALGAGLSALVAQAILTPVVAVLSFVLLSLALTGGLRQSDRSSK